METKWDATVLWSDVDDLVGQAQIPIACSTGPLTRFLECHMWARPVPPPMSCQANGDRRIVQEHSVVIYVDSYLS